MTEYPEDSNPFDNPGKHKPGRRPRHYLSINDDLALNPRYEAKTFVVPTDLIQRVCAEAGKCGYALEHCLELKNGKILMRFTKRTGPLIKPKNKPFP